MEIQLGSTSYNHLHLTFPKAEGRPTVPSSRPIPTCTRSPVAEQAQRRNVAPCGCSAPSHLVPKARLRHRTPLRAAPAPQSPPQQTSSTGFNNLQFRNNCGLGCVTRSAASRLKELIISLCSAPLGQPGVPGLVLGSLIQ